MTPENMTRIALLRNAPLNSWIALSKDETRIVASGANLSEVTMRLDEMGDVDAVILKTPFVWGPIFG